MIEAESLALLVKRLPESKDIIISEHMPLARRIGIWYAKRNRRQREDLISAAYMGLVQAVQRMIDNKPEILNATAYIVSTVHYFCRDEIVHDHLVFVPKEHLDTRGCLAPINDECVEDDPSYRLVSEELLASFVPRYRVVIELRLAGWTQTQIAAKLNVSQPMVYKYLKEIKEHPTLRKLL